MMLGTIAASADDAITFLRLISKPDAVAKLLTEIQEAAAAGDKRVAEADAKDAALAKRESDVIAREHAVASAASTLSERQKTIEGDLTRRATDMAASELVAKADADARAKALTVREDKLIAREREAASREGNNDMREAAVTAREAAIAEKEAAAEAIRAQAQETLDQFRKLIPPA